MSEERTSTPSNETREILPGMTVIYLGLLRRGPKWIAEETPEVQALQEGHLANNRRMWEMGKLVAVGPLIDDGDLRGAYIFKVKSPEEARALVELDPAVQAGRLVFEVHPWMVFKGIFPEEE